MAEQDTKQEKPRGFSDQARGLAGEYAHEQGWGLNEEERSKEGLAPEDTDGGNDYDYGARDFGDEPVNTAIAADAREPIQNQRTQPKKES